MDSLKIRCSSLSKIMGTPKKKGETLTVTAKTYIKSLVKQMVFDYEVDIESKYFTKGEMSEGKSIELYNEVYFTDYVKNETRLTNKIIEYLVISNPLKSYYHVSIFSIRQYFTKGT